jgi:hypothetical protein
MEKKPTADNLKAGLRNLLGPEYNPSKGQRARNLGTGIVGEREGGAVPEAQNFLICPDCGQAYDKRDLGEVIHHMEAGHWRLPEY